jgi:hypothetical protein
LPEGLKEDLKEEKKVDTRIRPDLHDIYTITTPKKDIKKLSRLEKKPLTII